MASQFGDALLLTEVLWPRKDHEVFNHPSSDEKPVLYLLTLKMKKPTVAAEVVSFLGGQRLCSCPWIEPLRTTLLRIYVE
jgi:hypothetical protein